jgi:hypothetical protein
MDSVTNLCSALEVCRELEREVQKQLLAEAEAVG